MSLHKAIPLAALVLSAVSILVGVLLYRQVGGDAVRACERANDVRRESNRRVPLHSLDAHNLIMLSRSLAVNRALEARAFTQLGRKFHTSRELEPLVVVLRRAAAEDRVIFRSEALIRFRRLALTDCQVVVKSGR